VCGLTAIYDPAGESQIDAALLDRMTDRLAHRGPDGRGTHIAPGIGLGHRRLSIIDVSGGHEPMFSAGGEIALIFNGEIYNFQALAEELGELGAEFKTRSDTEVILKAWEQWGEACVEHLEGMFAFVIWDARSQTFFMARDRLGKKPLYYAELEAGTLIVGSELKALMCHPSLDLELDPQAVEDFFAFGYIPDPKSIFKSVRKLPAAHSLLWKRGREKQLRAYWDVSLTPFAGDEEKAARELLDRVSQSVKSRMISDVPFGAFLSGGVDSSAIVAMMSEQLPEPVKTFSIGFDRPDYDETSYAEQVASQYRTDHLARQVAPDDFSLIDELTGMFDEPFADSSAIPTYRLCQVARERVTVCLSGDGGDEVFAGYRRHRFHAHQERIKSWIPQGLRRSIFGTLGRLYPKADWAPRFLRAKATLQELAMSEEEAYFNSITAMNTADRARILSTSFKEGLHGYSAINVVKRHFENAKTDDPLRRAQYVDIKTWLPGDILVKVDRTSMATSLEVRAPLLEYNLVEFGLSLDASLKVKGQEGKHVFKRALKDKLPENILYRPKQGFSVPLCDWFRGPLKQQVRQALNGAALKETGYFDMEALSSLAEEHISGRRDHARSIWQIFVFDAFLRSLKPTAGRHK
jgi:asparagine synthase (glutamine-hydrolysing)